MGKRERFSKKERPINPMVTAEPWVVSKNPSTGEVKDADPVNHPKHYTSHPSGVECISITEHFNFNIGNAIKYAWRAGLKSADPREDLEKSRWYINREIERLGMVKP